MHRPRWKTTRRLLGARGKDSLLLLYHCASSLRLTTAPVRHWKRSSAADDTVSKLRWALMPSPCITKQKICTPAACINYVCIVTVLLIMHLICIIHVISACKICIYDPYTIMHVSCIYVYEYVYTCTPTTAYMKTTSARRAPTLTRAGKERA